MPHSDPGTRYREIRQLGAGGMGTVILGEDSVLGRPVALKRVPGRGDARSALRLKREALVGASLNHPNIVSVYDALIEDGGDVVIVMEYVEGQTLADRIRSGGPLAPAEALRVLRGVAAALDAIHAQGIVHRDVKPANVLLGRDGAVKLADLGIADVADRTRITSADAVVGSFSYMSAEQLNGAVPSPAMDVYALSAVAYEMLTGQKARPESNPLALAHAISTKPAPDLREALPSVPPAAAEVLQRGMSADPARRPEHAGALVSRLEAAFAPERSTQTVPIALAGAPRARREAPPVRERPAPAASRAADPRAPGPAPARPSAPRSPSRLAPGLAAAAVLAVAGVIAAVLLSVGGPGRSGARVPAADRTRAGAGPTRTSQTSTHSSRTSTRARQTSTRASRTSTGSTSTHTSTGSATSTTSHTASTPAAGTGTASGSSRGASTGSKAHGRGASARPGANAASTPAAIVQQFYTAAAAHRYSQAWSLADSNMQNQLGGYAAFQNQMSAVRSITFHQAREVSGAGSDTVTVALRTTSVQRDGTQQCAGTARTVRSGGSWLLDGISISCS
ncbi:MAG TPA: protein kinase [Solirubrobacteraceae bacterium]|nr:protein kinase [Solirubrobacteraceae bacterium]